MVNWRLSVVVDHWAITKLSSTKKTLCHTVHSVLLVLLNLAIDHRWVIKIITLHFTLLGDICSFSAWLKWNKRTSISEWTVSWYLDSGLTWKESDTEWLYVCWSILQYFINQELPVPQVGWQSNDFFSWRETGRSTTIAIAIYRRVNTRRWLSIVLFLVTITTRRLTSKLESAQSPAES